MYADCKNCPVCATVTGGGRTITPPLHPIPVQYPFQIIGVDVIELPKTKTRNKLCISIPGFSHKMFPIPDHKSSSMT